MSPRGRRPLAAAPSSSPARIALHIDELVLHGVALRDRHRVADALERELARLVADGGVPTAPTPTAPTARAATAAPAAIVVPRGGRPEDLGRGVAGAIYEALGRAPARTDREDGS